MIWTAGCKLRPDFTKNSAGRYDSTAVWKVRTWPVNFSLQRPSSWMWTGVNSVLRQFLPHGLSSTAAVILIKRELGGHDMEAAACGT